MFWFVSALIALVLLTLLVLWYVWRASRGRMIAQRDIRKLEKAFSEALAQSDPHRRVLDAEKVLDRALSLLRYTGSFSDKLSAASPRFSNRQSLWEAHRTRNIIAHEVGCSIERDRIDHACNAYHHALRELS